jgi:hypothetical protein
MLGVHCDPIFTGAIPLLKDFVVGLLSYPTPPPWVFFALAHLLDSVYRLPVASPAFWTEQSFQVLTMVYFGLLPLNDFKQLVAILHTVGILSSLQTIVTEFLNSLSFYLRVHLWVYFTFHDPTLNNPTLNGPNPLLKDPNEEYQLVLYFLRMKRETPELQTDHPTEVLRKKLLSPLPTEVDAFLNHVDPVHQSY